MTSLQNKIEAARLMNYRSIGGHTPLSWACCVGDVRAAEILISHGACVGVGTDVEHPAAAAIQSAWKHYSWKVSNKRASIGSVAERFAHDAAVWLHQRSAIHRLRVVRRTARIPIMEAIYNGHVEMIKYLLGENASLFIFQFAIPLGPVPTPFVSCRRQYVKFVLFGTACALVGWQQYACVRVCTFMSMARVRFMLVQTARQCLHHRERARQDSPRGHGHVGQSETGAYLWCCGHVAYSSVLAGSQRV